MSNLGRAMGQMFGGESASFGEQVRALKQEYGTVTAMAKAVGVDRRTVSRWENPDGRTGIRSPMGASAEKVGRAYREALSKSRVIPSDSNVKVTYGMPGKGGRARRSYTVDGQHLDLRTGTMDQARQAFVVGGGEAAAKAFIDGIQEQWYHDSFEDDMNRQGESDEINSPDTFPSAIG